MDDASHQEPPRIVVSTIEPPMLRGWPEIRRFSIDDIATDAVVLVDARARCQDALAETRALAGRGRAILAVAARSDARDFYEAGATHFLGDPRDDDEIEEALLFAARAPLATDRRSGDDAAPIVSEDADHAIVVALSRFDIVNAAYGRPAGDALLAVAERRLRTVAASIFASAQVERMGGAAFLVAGTGEVALATARIGDTLARPFPVGDAMAALGARVGVATREDGEDGARLLRRATDALARARDGATVEVADAGGGAPIADLAVDLHRAIERDEIAILFQPQVRIADNRIIGVEALARWDHPLLGSLGADPLFAAADRADLGLALSDHIQRIALEQAATWPDRLASLDLSLNVTAADIARAGFAEAFLTRVAASGFSPVRLTVEITESALIADLDAAAVALETLRGAGIRVAIDDFGAGYASFAYLAALPLDRLKIDKSFAHDIAPPRGRAVVRAIIAVADALGLAVIAEGVETRAQRDLLANDGCGQYQGFLCAGPIDTPALVALLETWP